jgi:hypothetical protein
MGLTIGTEQVLNPAATQPSAFAPVFLSLSGMHAAICENWLVV